LQNSPPESSFVVVALVENYSTSKPLNVSPVKSQILICDTLVAYEGYYLYIHSPTNGNSSNHYQITIVKN
jgi:hypothetical protein